MRPAVALLASVIVVMALPRAATAELLSGRAFVLDGDSIMLNGQRIRILDIDAPESGQLCFKKADTFDQNGWQCGQQAATALSDWIGQLPVTCDTTVRGIHKGWLARCTAGSQDLAQ